MISKPLWRSPKWIFSRLRLLAYSDLWVSFSLSCSSLLLERWRWECYRIQPLLPSYFSPVPSLGPWSIIEVRLHHQSSAFSNGGWTQWPCLLLLGLFEDLSHCDAWIDLEVIELGRSALGLRVVEFKVKVAVGSRVSLQNGLLWGPSSSSAEPQLVIKFRNWEQ